MSSESDSDEDFKPCEPEAVSEEDSADDETDLQYEKELENKSNKRKMKSEIKNKKKRKTRSHESPKKTIETAEEVTENKLDPEEEKKKEEELWLKFLDGTDSKPKIKNYQPITSTKTQETEENISLSLPDTTKQPNKDDNEAKERRIFEFAGEKIIVEDNVIKEKIKLSDNPTSENKLQALPQKHSKGGISNVLNLINKNNKLSTLEKSKLDWETYKKDEGIEDELQHINKGKSGYLDRKDFLERTDMRQYEIERDLRLSRRSKR